MDPLEWLAGLLQFILGFLFGSIVTGLFTVYVVIPLILKNKDIQELLALLREGKEHLKKLLENQQQ